MKNLSLFKVLFLALAVFAISSCGEDADDPSSSLSPDVQFLDGVDVISDNADLSPGASFSVNILASKGTSEMSSLTVYQDDVQIDLAAEPGRIEYAHLDAGTANNPQVIVGTDVDALDWTITVVAQADQSVSTYDFEITDKDGNKTSVVLDINTIANTVFEVNHSVAMGCFTVDATLDAATDFCLSIDATSGADALSTVTVYENNDVIDVSRLDWAENPYTLTDTEVNGFTDLSVLISSHDVGTSEYRMVVTDASGATMEAGVFVTIGAPATEITGVLLNSAGMTGTGGCDLNTGMGTGSTAMGADIKDEGIDNGPVDTNWKQQISGTNGSEIRNANNLPEGFSFNNIAIKEEIIGAFNESDPISVTNAIDPVANPDYTEFVVRNSDDEYFYIKITSITKTPDDNLDQYTLSIKQ